MAKRDEGFTQRVLMALATARADRDAIDADIRIMEAALAKEVGAMVRSSVAGDRLTT